MPNFDKSLPLTPRVYHHKEALTHPNLLRSENNPGSLSLARSSEEAWAIFQCGPTSLLYCIEFHVRRGLINIIASKSFALGELAQTYKRDLQNIVVSIVEAYNCRFSPLHNVPGISIHENHLIGDGKTYPDFYIPRRANGRDYDHYHTLGVPFAENGNMLPHYHLEYNFPLNFFMARHLLISLRMQGRIAGREIISYQDMWHLLKVIDRFPRPAESSIYSPWKKLTPITPMLSSPQERAVMRDRLHGEFIALSSANTERHMSSQHLRNMHMNSFRPAEPLWECFAYGKTSLLDDLERVENGNAFHAPENALVKELVAIDYSFRMALEKLPAFTNEVGFLECFQLQQRLITGRKKIRSHFS